MVAPSVVVEIEIFALDVWVPAVGLKLGVATVVEVESSDESVESPVPEFAPVEAEEVSVDAKAATPKTHLKSSSVPQFNAKPIVNNNMIDDTIFIEFSRIEVNFLLLSCRYLITIHFLVKGLLYFFLKISINFFIYNKDVQLIYL